MKVLPPIRAAFSMIQGTCPASPEAVSAPRYATTPKSVQISRYAPTKIQVDTEGRLELCLSRWTRAKTRFIEAVVGNIIAIIMTTQIARNTVAPIPIVKPMPILFIMRDCQIRITHDAAARISSSARKSGCARCKRMVLPLTVTEPRPKGTAVPKPGVRARSPRICRGAGSRPVYFPVHPHLVPLERYPDTGTSHSWHQSHECSTHRCPKFPLSPSGTTRRFLPGPSVTTSTLLT